MKKTCESGKLISNRHPVERRNSNNDLVKPGSTQELTSTECFLPSPSDLNKKIKEKLRVRRATGSQKKISKDIAERINTSDKMIEEPLPAEAFEQKINFLWENSEEVGNAVNSWASVIKPQEMKEKIIREWGLIQCQVHSSELEEVVLARVLKLGNMAKAAKRCREHEEVMGRKFEERMKKLGAILKSR